MGTLSINLPDWLDILIRKKAMAEDKTLSAFFTAAVKKCLNDDPRIAQIVKAEELKDEIEG